MRSTRARLAVGMTVAVVVALGAPVLRAVAMHSGNESGNLPVEGTLARGASVAATGSWAPTGDALRYRFEVVSTGDAGAKLDEAESSAHHRAGGEAVAYTERCDESGCTRERTWRGTLSSISTDGGGLIADPTLSAAIFRGWLRDEQTQRGCRFEVRWQAAQGATPNVASNGDADLHALTLEANVSASRAATAAVDAACWNTAFSALGEGAGVLSRAEHVPVAAATTSPHPPEVP